MARLKDILERREDNLDESDVLTESGIEWEFKEYQKDVKKFDKKKLLSFVRKLKNLNIGPGMKLVALVSALELADRYEKKI